MLSQKVDTKSIVFCFIFFISILGQLNVDSLAIVIDNKEGDTKLVRYFIFDTIPLNLEEVTESADRIFTGICTNTEVIKHDKRAKLPVVKYTFEITDKIRGLENKDKITFKQWQPTTKHTGYEIGKKYIIFLHADSSLGLTSPVGFLQGQFTVEKDFSSNRELVTNKLSNTGLIRNLRTQKTIAISVGYEHLYNEIEKLSERGEKIDYQDFVRFVKYLAIRK